MVFYSTQKKNMEIAWNKVMKKFKIKKNFLTMKNLSVSHLKNTD